MDSDSRAESPRLFIYGLTFTFTVLLLDGGCWLGAIQIPALASELASLSPEKWLYLAVFVGGFTFECARRVATLVCRYCGLSLETREIETVYLSTKTHPPLSPIVLSRGSDAYLHPLFLALMTGMFAWLWLSNPSRRIVTFDDIVMLLIFPASFFSATIALGRNALQPAMKSDSWGLTGTHYRGFLCQRAPWTRIVQVDFAHRTNVFGTTVESQIIARDNFGRALVRLKINAKSESDAKQIFYRIEEAIRGRAESSPFLKPE